MARVHLCSMRAADACWSAVEQLSHSAVWPDLQELYKDSGAASQILVTFWRLPVIYLFLVLTRGLCCFPASSSFLVSHTGGLHIRRLQPLPSGVEPSLQALDSCLKWLKPFNGLKD